MSDKKRVDVALVERGLARAGKRRGAGDVRRGLYRQKIRWIKRLHR